MFSLRVEIVGFLGERKTEEFREENTILGARQSQQQTLPTYDAGQNFNPRHIAIGGRLLPLLISL